MNAMTLAAPGFPAVLTIAICNLPDIIHLPEIDGRRIGLAKIQKMKYITY
jgi:hypothetical protein